MGPRWPHLRGILRILQTRADTPDMSLEKVCKSLKVAEEPEP